MKFMPYDLKLTWSTIDNFSSNSTPRSETTNCLFQSANSAVNVCMSNLDQSCVLCFSLVHMSQMLNKAEHDQLIGRHDPSGFPKLGSPGSIFLGWLVLMFSLIMLYK